MFGSRSARKEVGKLLARPEYFSKMPNDLTEIAAYMRKQASRDRQAPKEFTIHRSREVQGLERAESNISRNLLTPTMGPNLAQNPAESEGQSVRFSTDPSIPTSICALLLKIHAVKAVEEVAEEVEEVEEGAEEVETNHKLNSTMLPEWNGAGETAIDYLSGMGFLASLSSKMKEGIVQLALFKWTSYTRSWWETLPAPD